MDIYNIYAFIIIFIVNLVNETENLLLRKYLIKKLSSTNSIFAEYSSLLIKIIILFLVFNIQFTEYEFNLIGFRVGIDRVLYLFLGLYMFSYNITNILFITNLSSKKIRNDKLPNNIGIVSLVCNLMSLYAISSLDISLISLYFEENIIFIIYSLVISEVFFLVYYKEIYNLLSRYNRLFMVLICLKLFVSVYYITDNFWKIEKEYIINILIFFALFEISNFYFTKIIKKTR